MRRFARLLNNGLYRSRNGAILGVCRGLSEHFDFNLFWLRAIIVVILLLSGIWPILILYFIAALMMKPEPVIPIGTPEEQEFYDSYVYSGSGVTQRLKRRYQNLEGRIQRMEHIVTDQEFDWEQKLHS